MLLYETMSANGSLAGKCSKDQPARYCNSQKDTLCIINPHGCSRGGRPINKDENVNSASTRARNMDRTMLMQQGARTSQVLQQTNDVCVCVRAFAGSCVAAQTKQGELMDLDFLYRPDQGKNTKQNIKKGEIIAPRSGFQGRSCSSSTDRNPCIGSSRSHVRKRTTRAHHWTTRCDR